MWAFGDVWTVIPDHRAGVSGICADDAGAAFARFRENLEDDEESVPEGLDPTAEHDTRWHVSWEIDAEGSTALGAARQVWADQFGRDDATDGDVCVFTVTDAPLRGDVPVERVRTGMAVRAPPEYRGPLVPGSHSTTWALPLRGPAVALPL